MQVHPIANGNSVDSVNLDSSMKEDAQSSFHSGSRLTYDSLHILSCIIVFPSLVLRSIMHTWFIFGLFFLIFKYLLSNLWCLLNYVVISLSLCVRARACVWVCKSPRSHPPPTFGSSPNPEAPTIQGNKDNVEDEDSAMNVTPYLSR